MNNENIRIPKNFHESWHNHVRKLFGTQSLLDLNFKILPKIKFYPEPANIFRVFEMPLDAIKVVIIGQDPYPEGQAIGYSFAVNEEIPLPASLNVIQNVIKGNTDYAIDKTLKNWIEQGVFLLNAALTVEEHKPGSHAMYWKDFTKEIVRIISLNNSVIWCLWGTKAQSFLPYINNIGTSLDADNISKNIVLTAPHPAKEMHTSLGDKFSNHNHFLTVNNILSTRNKTLINW